MNSTISELLQAVRTQQPLVHSITNDVVTNTTANALLALGASPIMATAIEEMEQMVRLVNALVINTGTLTNTTILSMERAARIAHEVNKPWILDPVGAGATDFRLNTNTALLKSKPTVVRGNASEIVALFTASHAGKGVDSTISSDDTVAFIKEQARAHGLVIAVTGKVDFVTDGERVAAIHNGHPLMAKVTGTGCCATAIIGAFLAVSDDPLMATVAGLSCWGLAGEWAADKSAGPGSLQMNLLDGLYQLDATYINEHCRVSWMESKP